jgi:hypothetical protein
MRLHEYDIFMCKNIDMSQENLATTTALSTVSRQSLLLETLQLCSHIIHLRWYKCVCDNFPNIADQWLQKKNMHGTWVRKQKDVICEKIVPLKLSNLQAQTPWNPVPPNVPCKGLRKHRNQTWKKYSSDEPVLINKELVDFW